MLICTDDSSVIGLRGSGVQGSKKGVAPARPLPKKSFSHYNIIWDGLRKVSLTANDGQIHPCEIGAPGAHLRTNCAAVG